MNGSGKCPVCKKNAVLTEHHEKLLDDEKIMMCDEYQTKLHRYYQFLEQNYKFKYGLGTYKS